MTHLTQISVPHDLVCVGPVVEGGRLRLRDTYAWHKLAWTCFPGRDGEKRDFLTRLDQRRGDFRLLIVSPTEPSMPVWCPAECWKSTPIPEDYLTHRVYRFQLCANPTRKVDSKQDGSVTKNGRRVPLRTRGELIAWIERKGEQGGFAVEETTLRTFSRGREYFQKQEGNGTYVRGLHSAVEFQGILTVTDPARFHGAFSRGIGSAKAFGFGLLVIAPAG